MKNTVSVLLFDPVTEEIVVVSRRNSTTQWGLPGGKVEETDANIREAAFREFEEETGLTIWMDFNEEIPVFTAPCTSEATGNKYMCSTFILTVKHTNLPFKPEEGLLVKWAGLDYLSDPDNTPFSKYNNELLDHFGLLHPMLVPRCELYGDE